MNIEDIFDFIEEEDQDIKRSYGLQISDHGVSTVQYLLDLPTDLFRQKFRMNQETFLRLSNIVIFIIKYLFDCCQLASYRNQCKGAHT